MVIFKKEYDGESLYDLDQDLIDNFNDRYEANHKDIIFDNDSLLRGKFSVTIKWDDV